MKTHDHDIIISGLIVAGILGLTFLTKTNQIISSYIISKNNDGVIESKNTQTEIVEFISNDARTVIQGTINALQSSGGIILFMPGTYNIIKQITFYDNISLVGYNKDTVIIEFSGAGQLFIDSNININFKSLTFKSNVNVNIDRIRINNTDSILFDNVKTIGGGKDWINFMVHFNTGNRNITLRNIEATGSIDSPFRFYKTNTGLFVDTYYAHDLVSCNCGDGMDLFGVRNANISNFRAINVPGNGLGIYADAKNVVCNNIYCENVGYGTGNSHIGKGLSIVRWDDKDPSDITINKLRIVNSNGHGLQIITQASAYNSVPGTISNIKVTDFQSTKSWWSGLTFEGGNVNDILIDNFIIAQANVSNTGSSPIYFNAASYSNVKISNGILVPPYQPFTVPPGATLENVQ